jgi:hypothetical protein
MTTSKTSARKIDLNVLRSRISGLLSKDEEREFTRIHQALATPRNVYALELAKDAFAFANHHRNERSPANNIAVRSIVVVADRLFELFDEVKLNDFVCGVAAKYEPFNFEELVYVLDDEIRLAHQASVFIEELREVFTLAEKHKKDFLAKCNKGFQFTSMRLSQVPGYIGPGASWGDFFGGVFCAIAIGLNAVAEIPTAGLATASIVVAVAGVGSEAYLQK